jgi:hypothetical protein
MQLVVNFWQDSYVCTLFKKTLLPLKPKLFIINSQISSNYFLFLQNKSSKPLLALKAICKKERNSKLSIIVVHATDIIVIVLKVPVVIAVVEIDTPRKVGFALSRRTTPVTARRSICKAIYYCRTDFI